MGTEIIESEYDLLPTTEDEMVIGATEIEVELSVDFSDFAGTEWSNSLELTQICGNSDYLLGSNLVSMTSNENDEPCLSFKTSVTNDDTSYVYN